MKNINYENQVLESGVEQEPNPHVPIIDIVRHGRTKYKELTDPSFQFNPEADDFKLDPEHLDLTAEGIEDEINAAHQLLEQIDKENEVVILASSPNFRAQSSALVVEDILIKNGVRVLNSGKIMDTLKLRQLTIKDKKDFPDWVAAAGKYDKDNPDRAKDTPDVKHPAIAEAMGHELSDLFAEGYPDIDKRFEDFVRYMTNIYNHLNPATQAALEGKTIRVVALTHEEVSITFLKKVLDIEQTTEKGQILQLEPQDLMQPGTDVEVKVTLFPKPGVESQSGEATVAKKFTLK